MKTISLTLRSRDDGAEKIAELVWENGTVNVVDAVPVIVDDLDRIISVGLVEWVGTPGSRERRHTPSTDPRFLERLGDYFARQSAFAIKVVERERVANRDPAFEQATVRRLAGLAVYVVQRLHQMAVINESIVRATRLPANRVLSTQWGTSQRRAVLRRAVRAERTKQTAES
jgi:hypothetical protein